jgi:hypothetical protein
MIRKPIIVLFGVKCMTQVKPGVEAIPVREIKVVLSSFVYSTMQSRGDPPACAVDYSPSLSKDADM